MDVQGRPCVILINRSFSCIIQFLIDFQKSKKSSKNFDPTFSIHFYTGYTMGPVPEYVILEIYIYIDKLVTIARLRNVFPFPAHGTMVPWYLRQAPMSILAVVQSCYAHQSKAHDKIYNSRGSNPTLKLSRIGL